MIQDRDCGDENDYDPTWEGFIGLLRDHRRFTEKYRHVCTGTQPFTIDRNEWDEKDLKPEMK